MLTPLGVRGVRAGVKRPQGLTWALARSGGGRPRALLAPGRTRAYGSVNRRPDAALNTSRAMGMRASIVELFALGPNLAEKR
jgi:hypothetical protein